MDVSKSQQEDRYLLPRDRSKFIGNPGRDDRQGGHFFGRKNRVPHKFWFVPSIDVYYHLFFVAADVPVVGRVVGWVVTLILGKRL